MEAKFYRCNECGAMFLGLLGEPDKMEAMTAGTTDGAREKHVPVYEVADGIVRVTVGAAEHPMMEAHYIQWICLQTKNGLQVKKLAPGEAPKAEFALVPGDEVVAVYEYCNLHGLWKG